MGQYLIVGVLGALSNRGSFAGGFVVLFCRVGVAHDGGKFTRLVNGVRGRAIRVLCGLRTNGVFRKILLGNTNFLVNVGFLELSCRGLVIAR